jgi:LacI family transcriptional regulator
MYRAANYLIQKHRRPAFFLGMRCDHQTDADRYHGYVCAMTDAGFKDQIASHTVLHELGSSDTAYWTEERKWWHGYEIAKRLLTAQRPPLSVACVKDYTAWGLYKAAEELNWIVGRDLFVTGFDDLTIAQLLKPALTTIQQSLREKGYVAARMLLQWIKTRRAPDVQVVHLPVTLIARESAG